jgi:hypothetical protein
MASSHGFYTKLAHLHHSVSVQYTSTPLGIQSSEQAEPSTEEEEEEAPVLLASLQFYFAIAMLVLALAYYWQIYDPSDTLKPGWVGAFG